MAATLGVLLIFLSDDAQAANRECADNTGLNLVVDTTELGGSVTVKCFENWTGGTAWSGFDALFGLRGTNNFPTSFVCQVGNMPKGDDCRTTDGRQEFWWYSIATNGHWNANPGKGVADSSGARAGEWHGLRYVKGKAAAPGTTPKVPSAPKPKPKPSPKPTSTSKPKPTSKPSASSKPKPSSSGTSSSKPGASSSSTTSPSPSGSKTSAPGSSSASTTSPGPSDSATSGAGEKDDSSPAAAGSNDGAESADPVGPEDSGVEAEDGRAPALPAEEAVEASERAQDSSAQHTRSENADSSPPVGTLIVGGVIVLLVGAGIFRHRTGKKLEGN